MSESSRSRSKRGEKITTIYPVDQTFLTETLKNIVLKVDDEGNLVALPVIAIDPTQNPSVFNKSPTIFKSVSGLTTNATIWTRSAGKRIRLLGFQVNLSKEAACAGALNFSIQGSGQFGQVLWRADVSAVALVAIGTCTIWTVNLPPNGIALNADDNLTITFSGALTAGVLTVTAWGTEE